MEMRVGINGFGRIGRLFLRIAKTHYPDLKVVAVNGTRDAQTLAHLFEYDSVYGKYAGTVEVLDEHTFAVDGEPVRVYRAPTPREVPWEEAGVDLVIEASGRFRDRETAAGHLEAGAKKVIITAPAKGEDITLVHGVNHAAYDPERHHIISAASCTTTALAPVAKVLHEAFGIRQGSLTTVHAYTGDQRIHDGTHKDLRRARAAGENIVPTSTGAAKALGKVLPELEGRMTGVAYRVPTPTVSLLDLILELEGNPDPDAVNTALRKASETELAGVLAVSEKPLVSSDYKGDPHAAIVDGLLTQRIGESLVRIVAWYDNEWGYTVRVAALAAEVARRVPALC
ncbi:glyceraldehyde-3-phosphate dehydrogenase, type I [Marinithermus hydrothermalis DSM 14884]|uniref:Glyceraldehyde-3-phosphate dehydrogenase n=2 Tax=Marinithermus TaxID=186191 RepID=F2NLG8_MARHT|nr:glyceraldehyde-3-phosphate dehydrogenase, type I [Marinithermus hydrothermalis DSM 14884]